MKNVSCLALLLIGLWINTASLAASFDCTKASTDIEKMVCTDPDLSTLDERLGRLYQAATQTNPDLKAAQQGWLRSQRNVCHDTACLNQAYQQRITELSLPPNHNWPVFTDKQLGIRFSYPPQRQISPACRGNLSCVALSETTMPSQTDYVLAFEVFEGGLEQIATEQANFSKHGANWLAKGRNGEYPAEVLQGDGWQGLKAVVDCGVSDENGFHAAAGECLWVVLSNGKRSIVIDSQGLVGNDALSLQSIRSIRFHD
jgi:uncharacterized protein